MSRWSATKATRLLAALLRIGWTVERVRGSHRTLVRPGWPPYSFAFHDGDEIGPKILPRIARDTGLRPEDLWPLGPESGPGIMPSRPAP